MHSINSLLSAGKSQKKTIIIIPTIEDLKRKERGEDYKNYLWFKKNSITFKKARQLI